MTAPHGKNRPVVFVPKAKPVEAMQWTGDNWDAISQWVYGEVVTVEATDWDSPDFPVAPDESGYLSVIEPVTDEALAKAGDWIIKAPDGWFVGDGTFLDKYEPVDHSGSEGQS